MVEIAPEGEKSMPGYETTVITKLSSTEEVHNAVRSKVEDILKKHDGELLCYEIWGKRKLAVRIKNELRSHYQYFAYTGDTGAVAELERNLGIDENITLYMSVRVNDGVSPEDIKSLKGPTPIMKPSLSASVTDVRPAKSPRSEPEPQSESKPEPQSESKSEEYSPKE